MATKDVGQFCVISLTEEDGALAVVPSLWLEKQNGQLRTYWPQPQAAFTSRVKRKEIPDPKWPQFPVRVIASTDDYEKAKQYERRAEQTSNPESEYEKDPKRRKTSVPLKFQDTESDADDEDAQQPTKVTKTKTNASVADRRPPTPPLYTPVRSSLVGRPTPAGGSRLVFRPSYTNVADAEDDDGMEPIPSTSVAMPELSDVQPLTTPTTARTPTGPLGKGDGRRRHSGNQTQSPPLNITQSDFQTYVYRTLSAHGELLRETLSLMRTLLGRGGNAEEDDLLIDFETLTTEEHLQACNQKLEGDPLYAKQLIRYLSSLGGTTLAEIVRKIMRRLASNGILAMYSLQGFKGKGKFEDLPIAKIIMSSTRKATNRRHTYEDIRNAMACVLTDAPRAPGGPLHKSKPKRRFLIQEDEEEQRIEKD